MFGDKLFFRKVPMVQLTKNFTVVEMACKCGCKRCPMDENFMEKLQALRDKVGPLKISSGFRCSDHNIKVASSGKNGPHTTGKAADILAFGALSYRIIGESYQLGFSGFGIEQKGPHEKRIIHLDTLKHEETKGPRPWTWSY